MALIAMAALAGCGGHESETQASWTASPGATAAAPATSLVPAPATSLTPAPAGTISPTVSPWTTAQVTASPSPTVTLTPSPRLTPGPGIFTVAIASRPDWAQGASVALLSNGRVLFAGGGFPLLGGWDEPSRVVAIYNPKDGSLKNTNTMKDKRACPVAVTLADGRVLVAGGGTITAELFYPASSTWSRTGSLLAPADCRKAILLRNGEVLIPGDVLDSRVQLYNPETGQFRWGAAAPIRADDRTYTLLGDGRVLFAGGGESVFMGGLVAVYANAELYDPATDTFTPTGSLVKPRLNAVAALLPDGRVLVAGGSTFKGQYNSSEIWDPATGKFALTGWLVQAREGAAAVTLESGKVLVVGGGSPLDPAYAELYDPATAAFVRTGSMTAVRWSPKALLLDNGCVLVSGGFSDGPYAELYWP